MRGVFTGLALSALTAFAFYRSMAVFLILIPLGLCYPLLLKRRKIKRRKEQLEQQFREAALILASTVGAGYSMENAMEAAVKELKLLYGEDGLICREFVYMQQRIRTNGTVEAALADFGERSGIEDIRNFAEVFAAAKRSGGSLSEILRYTAEVIREKAQIQEEIKTMTAARRLEQRVMYIIPFFLIFYLEVSSPGFFSGMYKSAAGRMIMTGCLAVYAVSYLLSQHILSIET